MVHRGFPVPRRHGRKLIRCHTGGTPYGVPELVVSGFTNPRDVALDVASQALWRVGLTTSQKFFAAADGQELDVDAGGPHV